MLEIISAAIRILISLAHLIVFVALAYWTIRFYKGFLRGENSITQAMATFCGAMALDHLWSVAGAIYTAFDVSPLFTFVSLLIRFITVYFLIGAIAFITWQFESNKDE